MAAARAPVKEAPVAEAGEDVTRESALPYSTPSEPILRTAEDEELDKEESLARRLTDSHLDWPNEAGVRVSFLLQSLLKLGTSPAPSH